MISAEKSLKQNESLIETYVAPDTRISKDLALLTPVITVTRMIVAITMTTRRSVVLEIALITIIGTRRRIMTIQATNIRVNLCRSDTGNIVIFESRETLFWGFVHSECRYLLVCGLKLLTFLRSL